MTWLNEPQNWKLENDHLSVFADSHTDFWRKTHYGFVRDSGHFYYEKVSGNFEVETEFRGKYESLYDQAGIMVRLDEANWIKAGIEHSDGQALLSSVLTVGQSDWATGPCAFRLPQTVYDGHWSACAASPWQIGMRLDRYAARPSALG